MEKPHWTRHVITFILIFGLGGFIFARGGCPGQQQAGRGHLPEDAMIELIEIAGWPLKVEIANTPETRQRGFNQRQEFIPGYGILFMFEEPANPMLITRKSVTEADVAFINEYGRIEKIAAAIPKDLRQLQSDEPVKYILGVRPGFFDDHGIAIGEKVNSLPQIQ